MFIEIILLFMTVVLMGIWIEIKGLGENEEDKD
jgi:hypothetical protein